MLKYLLIFAAAVAMIYFWKDGQAAPDGPATPTAYRYSRGNTVPLQPAGVVILSGPGLRNGAMTVYCEKGAFAFGWHRGTAIGLNGYSSGLGRQGTIVLGNRQQVRIITTDKSDLVALGAIDPDADPLSYNRKFDEGLKIALQKCGT